LGRRTFARAPSTRSQSTNTTSTVSAWAE
jgi:hypothetical protein